MLFSQDEDKGVTAGEWLGKSYFHCSPKRGLFVRLNSCQPDVRFQSFPNSALSLGDYSESSGKQEIRAVMGEGCGRTQWAAFHPFKCCFLVFIPHDIFGWINSWIVLEVFSNLSDSLGNIPQFFVIYEKLD